MDEKDLKWLRQVWCSSIHALYEDIPGTESYERKRLITLLVQEMARAMRLDNELALERFGCQCAADHENCAYRRSGMSSEDWEAEAWKRIKGENANLSSMQRK